ncbi:hypothetical protein P255_00237 [Acinetobacter brisouii CIP 110357]|uniref:histidine kinase n=1 Tax=Acinetobacter brisouii CIP 110357 TaxID=1341683 RepID=V2UW23_9GAMM|nr:ATP-binding protein [Acinetobacter brisouii]ENV48725.1 hypothetical protein F954_00460 [Acinetobacter brisouii ANC 4119]ESK52845.1 hypothetical protein P255_00237 [Acinetobacter brisouii CIP 110357]
MELKFRVIDKITQETTFCNLKEEFKFLLPRISLPSEIINSGNLGKIRCGLVDTEKNKIFFISNSKDYIQSSSRFKSDVLHLTSLIDNFLTHICQQQIDFQLQKTQRLSHNIRSINANCLTSFFSFFPQEELSSKDNKIQTKIEKITKENHLDIPNLLLKLHKNHLAIKTEFEVFEKLYTKNPFLSKKKHKIHRVLMNVYYPFFSDFQEKGVLVNIYPSELKSIFDYDTLHVAFFHLFENAYKYSKPNSSINIMISEDLSSTLITFNMESLAIDSSEIPLIFTEGWSSNISKETGKSGNGLGMYIVKRLVELNNGNISFEAIPNTLSKYGSNGLEIYFQKNKIVISLNKNQPK